MSILIAVAHEKTREFLVYSLKSCNSNILETNNAGEALEILKSFKPKILILDANLKHIDGSALCSIIKKNPDLYGRPYIITLSTTLKDECSLKCLKLGADNHFKKPYDREEITLMVNSASKRAFDIPEDKKKIKYKNIQIDLSNKIIKEDERYVSVTKREYDLFHYMVINKNLTLTRKKILSNLWNNDSCNERIVDVNIRRLRSKLKSIGNDIVTINGLGYRLAE